MSAKDLKNKIKCLEEELWEEKKKVCLLFKYDKLLFDIFKQYRHVLDHNTKTEYNQLAKEYNLVFERKPKSIQTQSKPEVSHNTTAHPSLPFKEVTIIGEIKNSSLEFDEKTKNYRLICRDNNTSVERRDDKNNASKVTNKAIIKFPISSIGHNSSQSLTNKQLISLKPDFNSSQTKREFYKVFNTTTNKIEYRCRVVGTSSDAQKSDQNKKDSDSSQSTPESNSPKNRSVLSNSKKEFYKVLDPITKKIEYRCRLIKSIPLFQNSDQKNDSGEGKAVIDIKEESPSSNSDDNQTESPPKQTIIRRQIAVPYSTSRTRWSRPPTGSRFIKDGLGQEYELKWVEDRYKYFNYETNSMEYRWGAKWVKTPILSTFKDNSPSLSSNPLPLRTQINVNPSQNSVSPSVSSAPKIWDNKGLKRITFGVTFKAHKYFDPKTQLYVCDHKDCDKGYKVYNKLRMHITKKHVKNLFCDFPNCGKGFPSQATLDRHKLLHRGIYPYNCDLCEYKTQSRQHFKDHMDSKHINPGKTYKCNANKCKRIFNSELSLRTHKKNCHPNESSKPIPCKHKGCSQHFYTYAAKRAHVNRVHTEFVDCDWPGCEFKTKKPYVLKEHRKNHTGEKPFQCHWPECDKQFRSKAYLTNHIKVHEKHQQK